MSDIRYVCLSDLHLGADNSSLTAIKSGSIETDTSHPSAVLSQLALSVVLIGMMAALWHMAWWIGIIFFAMVLISQGLVIAAIVTSQPPDSVKEQERKRRSKKR